MAFVLKSYDDLKTSYQRAIERYQDILKERGFTISCKQDIKNAISKHYAIIQAIDATITFLNEYSVPVREGSTPDKDKAIFFSGMLLVFADFTTKKVFRNILISDVVGNTTVNQLDNSTAEKMLRLATNMFEYIMKDSQKFKKEHIYSAIDGLAKDVKICNMANKMHADFRTAANLDADQQRSAEIKPAQSGGYFGWMWSGKSSGSSSSSAAVTEEETSDDETVSAMPQQ